jgi:hypothetical protein
MHQTNSSSCELFILIYALDITFDFKLEQIQYK